MKNNNLPSLRIPYSSPILADERDWENRFEIRSETSDRIYIVSQHKTKRHWGCSCPGYRIHRKCKHLNTLALPCFEKPYEVNIIK